MGNKFMPKQLLFYMETFEVISDWRPIEDKQRNTLKALQALFLDSITKSRTSVAFALEEMELLLSRPQRNNIHLHRQNSQGGGGANCPQNFNSLKLF